VRALVLLFAIDRNGIASDLVLLLGGAFLRGPVREAVLQLLDPLRKLLGQVALLVGIFTDVV